MEEEEMAADSVVVDSTWANAADQFAPLAGPKSKIKNIYIY